MKISFVKFTIGILLLHMSSFAVPGQELTSGKEIVQNEDILRTLIAAQKSAELNFPTGSLKGRARNEIEKQHAEFSAVWQGNSYYIEASCTESAVQKDGDVAEVKKDIACLITPRSCDCFDKTHNLVQRISNGQMTPWQILMQRPQDFWFAAPWGAPQTWSDVLELRISPESPFVDKVQIENGDIVRINSVHQKVGANVSMEFSLKQGGNLIRVSSEPADSSLTPTIRMLVECTWTQVDQNRWSLQRYAYRSTSADQELTNDTPGIVIEIDEFDANPEIAQNRFTFSSLSLPKGTLVEEHGANFRRYRVGGDGTPEDEISERKLKEFSKRLKEKVFEGQQPSN